MGARRPTNPGTNPVDPRFPVLLFSERPQLGSRLDKLPDVIALVKDRPVAWVDDDLDNAATEWAAQRTVPTLLVQPSPSLGLQASEVSRLLLFAANHRPEQADVRHRAGVVVINNGRIAVVERNRAGIIDFVLPGSGAEPGETIQEAAHREALEETSLDVRILGLVAHIAFGDGDHRAMQHYFAADVIGGTIGPGTGPEFGDGEIERGSYRPKWLPLEEVPGIDIRPAALAVALNQDLDGLLSRPLLLEDRPNGGRPVVPSCRGGWCRAAGR